MSSAAKRIKKLVSKKEIRRILEEKSYTEIAFQRIIDPAFNEIGYFILRQGLKQIIRQIGDALNKFQQKLPKEKIARKTYTFKGHIIILDAMQTMLETMRIKNHMSYIPGTLMDELNNVLKEVNTTNHALNPQIELHVLRNLFKSCMQIIQKDDSEQQQQKYEKFKNQKLEIIKFKTSMGSGEEQLKNAE